MRVVDEANLDESTVAKRSKHVWAVIVLTLAVAVYFGWAVLDALLILSAQGVRMHWRRLLPAAIVICVFFVGGFRVYRGYR